MTGLLTPFITVGLSVLHLSLAAGVTLHALANKRDPGSAVAWIGLAWLSPVIGSVLYLLLGINRVRRRAQTLRAALGGRPGGPPTGPRRDDRFAALEIAGRHISQRCVEPGNSIVLLHNGDGAYPQMLAAIYAAKSSVSLSSYIFRADSTGDEFIAALARARHRGVDVRVLIDGYGGGYIRSSAYRLLHDARVPAARFLHSVMPWRMPFLNLRTHRKILVVDGRTAFTGGLNIGDENVTALRPHHPVLDTHFRVEGPVVGQLADAFAEQWYFTTGEALSGPAWFPSLQPVGERVARVVTSGPDQDLDKIALLIIEALGCARSSVRLMTPYFLPDDRIITALALAAMRGVDVEIVLPENSNHPSVDWAMRAHIEPLLTAGCQVWLRAPPFDHSKLMTVDELWCFVGSANWDTRSFTLNFEVNLEVYDSDLARQVNAKIAENRELRVSVADLRARSLPRRLRDSAARLFLPYL
jgi:cardiolipin synthase